MRSYLGLGSAAQQASTAFALQSHTHTSGDVTGLGSAALTASTAYSLSGHAHAASDITSGTLSVARGGTGELEPLQVVPMVSIPQTTMQVPSLLTSIRPRLEQPPSAQVAVSPGPLMPQLVLIPLLRLVLTLRSLQQELHHSLDDLV